jgi:hypothetical protein
MKYAGNMICAMAAVLWHLSMTAYMAACAKGQVEFVGRRGTPIELPLVLGMFTVGMMIVLGVLYHKKVIFTWAFITSLITLLATLGIFIRTFLEIAAVA